MGCVICRHLVQKSDQEKFRWKVNRKTNLCIVLVILFYFLYLGQYLGFPPSHSTLGARYSASTSLEAKQMDFWIYFHKDSLLLLWKINNDLTTDLIFIVNSTGVQDRWHKVSVNVNANSVYPIQVSAKYEILFT